MSTAASVNGTATDRIEHIDAWRVAYPVADRSDHPGAAGADPFNAASPTSTRIEALIVRVCTADGLTGWGEAFGHRCNPATMAALRAIVGPFALARSTDPADFSAAAARTFHPFGRGGPVAYAASGIDIALWDTEARRAGVPVRELLAGTPVSGEIRTYASLPGFQGDQGLVVDAVAAMAERGFEHVKLHETQPAALTAVAEAFGDLHLAADMNGYWESTDSAALAHALAPLGLWFLEEPTFPVSDMAGLATFRSAGIRTAAGENAGDVEDLLAALATGNLSIAQPSVGKIGGLTGTERVYAVEADTGSLVMPHCYCYGPAFFAAAAAVAAHPGEGAFLETPYFAWEDTLHELQQATPSLTLPDAPGLGFDADPGLRPERVVEQFSLS